MYIKYNEVFINNNVNKFIIYLLTICTRILNNYKIIEWMDLLNVTRKNNIISAFRSYNMTIICDSSASYYYTFY